MRIMRLEGLYNVMCAFGLTFGFVGLAGFYCYYACKEFDPLLVFIFYTASSIFSFMAAVLAKKVMIERRKNNGRV